MSKGFLLHRRNEGLGDCLFNLGIVWWFAKETDRTLVIDWTANKGYSRDLRRNLFLAIFENPKDRWDFPVWCQESSYEGQRGYDKLPTTKLIFNDERLFPRGDAEGPQDCLEVNSYLFDQLTVEQTKDFYNAITLVPEVQKLVDDFAEEHFGTSPVLGIHIRHGDGEVGHFARVGRRLKHPDKVVNKIVVKVRELQSATPDLKVFLATDSLDMYDLIKEQVPEVIFHMGWRPPRNSGGHRRVAKSKRVDPAKVLYDAAVDMWLLARCVGFIQPTWSHFLSYAKGMGVPKVEL